MEQTITFNSDNTYQSANYIPSTDNEDACVLDDYDDSGDWSTTSKGKLQLSTGDIKIEIEYTVSGNTLTMSFDDSLDGEEYTLKSVYKRK